MRLLIAIAVLVAYSVFWSTKQGAFRQQNDGIVATYKDGRKDILVLRNVSGRTSVCRVEIGGRSTKDYVLQPDMVSYVNRALLTYRWHCHAGTEYRGHIEKRGGDTDGSRVP